MAAIAFEDIYTLTPLQAGLLYHALQDPSGGIYVEQARCRMIGQLDAPRLIFAWQQAVARYDALRSSVQWKGLRHPVQIVHRRGELLVTIEDWSAADSLASEQRLESWLEKDMKAGFDLTRPPLLRIALFRLAPDDHILVWTFHHLILDAWAEANVLTEVVRAYETGSTNPSPAPKFRDYVRWLKTLDHSKSVPFWREYLRDAQPQSRARGQRVSYRTILRQLSPQTESSVRGCAAKARTTVHTIVLSLWAMFLRAWSGHRDVVFGVTVSGRTPQAPGAFEQVGLLFNTVPFRLQLDDTETTNELLRRAHSNYASVAPHELTPLSIIRQTAELGTDEIFDTVAVFLNHGFLVQGTMLGGCEVRDLRYNSRSSYALTFRVMERSPMTLELLYDESIVDRARAESILNALETALLAIVSGPGSPVREIVTILSRGIQHPTTSGRGPVSERRLSTALAEIKRLRGSKLAEPAGSADSERSL
jgi:hypothetical protein